MSWPDGGQRLEALRVGGDAHAALFPGDGGTVIAAFRQALCVRLPRGLVALGGAAMDDGPLHLVCRGAGPADWRVLAPAGSAARVTADRRRLAGAGIGFGRASVWQPSPPRETARSAASSRCRTRFRR